MCVCACVSVCFWCGVFLSVSVGDCGFVNFVSLLVCVCVRVFVCLCVSSCVFVLFVGEFVSLWIC